MPALPPTTTTFLASKCIFASLPSSPDGFTWTAGTPGRRRVTHEDRASRRRVTIPRFARTKTETAARRGELSVTPTTYSPG